MTSSILLLAGSVAATLVLYGLFEAGKFFYREWTSPLHHLPGPKSPNFLYGNFKQIYEAENSTLHEKWVEEYGSTLRYKMFFGMNRLYTVDPKAINHILMNSLNYQKPSAAIYNLSQIVGNGVLVVEGEKHRQQRRIMNPAFGAAQIRELTEIFVDKSIQLRDIWLAESESQGGTGRIDVLSWLSRMTLDVIGLAGFNYHFNSLNKDSAPSELNDAFNTLFRAGTSFPLIPFLRGMVKPLRYIPLERDRVAKRSHERMAEISTQLLRESQANIEKEGKINRGRDLLSLLVRANMQKDLPESQKMSEKDVLSQIPTFLVAGHETTSTGTTWALYGLCREPEVQRKLRAELSTLSTDNPTMDELNALPYLDAVVRESLRIYAPVPSTIRVATQDDVLPLEKPFKDRNGVLCDSIPIKKGQTMMVPILAMNRAKWIWGEDAAEFRPERWEKVPEQAGSIPGIWGNMLTFLGGPRACIGYRFSIIEMKALLFTLVRAFEFELGVPVEDIKKKSTIVQRPVLASDPTGKNQLPLLVRPVSAQT